MLYKIDDVFLNITAKISLKLQNSIGLTCYSVARLGIYMAAVDCFFDIANYFKQFSLHPTHPVAAAVSLLGILSMYRFDVELIFAEKLDHGNIITPIAAKMAWWGLRMLFIGYTLGNLIRVIGGLHTEGISAVILIHDNFFSLGMCVYLYFAYHTPLPRTKSKLRNWMDSRSFHLKPIAEPAN
jgi:hypothetical protein